MRRTLSTITLTLTLTFFLLVLTSFAATGGVNGGKKDVSPYDYGLRTARNGVERYQVLLKTHQAAVKAGVNVNYSGIDTLQIDVPESPNRIPLTQYNDFKGCVLVVKNTSKKDWLFYVANKEQSVQVSKKLIDKGDFRSISELSKGKYLLLIEDEKPWVLNRRGHDYGHQRRDILLVKNGIAVNRTVMPYNNVHSSPTCTYIPVIDKPFVVKNLTVIRDSSCTFVTSLFFVSGFDNVQFSNVYIYTPDNSLTGDRAIRVYNSTNVTFTDVYIKGTYSQPDYSGYGFSLGNIWNFKGKRLYGKGNWGVFGTNNMNTVHIEDSQINRFDIHCYGRDLSYDRVVFFDRYNSHSSVFGTIVYNNCTFTNFVPSQFGGSYNAFVAHNVEFNNCVFNLAPKKNYLCCPLGVTNEINTRPELTKKCLPNINIKNMKVNMAEGVKDFCLFSFKRIGNLEDTFYGISTISIDGLTVNSTSNTSVRYIQLSNRIIKTPKKVRISIKNVNINQPKQGFVEKMLFSNEALLRFNIPVDEEEVRWSNVVNLRLE